MNDHLGTAVPGTSGRAIIGETGWTGAGNMFVRIGRAVGDNQWEQTEYLVLSPAETEDLRERLENPSFGHCDECGALVDAEGCLHDRRHLVAMDIDEAAALERFLACNEADQDRLYNRVTEHNDGEHTTSWRECPWCEGDSDLASVIERRYGLKVSAG